MQNAIIYMVFFTWPPTKLLPIVEGNIRLLVLVYLIIRNKWKSAVISVKVGLSTSNCVGGELESGSWHPLHFFLLFFLLPYCFSLLPFCLCLLSSISSFFPSLPCSCSQFQSHSTLSSRWQTGRKWKRDGGHLMIQRLLSSPWKSVQRMCGSKRT